MGRALLTAGIAILLAACSLIGPMGCPTALLAGTLVNDGNGGLAVDAGFGPTAVRWPDGYWVGGSDKLVLHDGPRHPIAAEDDTIYVGGGMNAAEDRFIACGYVNRDPP